MTERNQVQEKREDTVVKALGSLLVVLSLKITADKSNVVFLTTSRKSAEELERR